MKPVSQTKFGRPDGNCFQASVASILEIPIESVPDPGHDDLWFDRFRRWCISTHALEPFMLDVNHSVTPSGFHLIGGASRTGGLYHCVVGFAGEMVHDPHPCGNGLEVVTSRTVFAPLDPRIIP